jgi:hypothetical protein
MTLKGLINDVVDDVTIGGLLPMNIPTSRIEKIVRDSIKMFIENDNRSTVENVMFLDTSKLKNGCMAVKLPDNIKSVTRLEHTSTSFGGFIGDENMSYGRSNVDGYGTGGLLNRVSIDMYNQFMKMNSMQYVPYDFTEYNHELTFLVKPRRNVFMEVGVTLDDDVFYNMIDFKDYVSAKLSLEFVRANNFIKTKLIGNREINFDDMKTSANDTLEAITDRWKEEQSDGIMLLD